MSDNIDIKIQFSDGEEQTFSSYEQVLAWSQSEISSWKEFQNKFNQHIQSINDGQLQNYWRTISQTFHAKQIDPLNVFSSQFSENSDITNTLKILRNSHYLSARSSKAQKIFSLSDNNPIVAILLLSIWHPAMEGEAIIANNRGVHNHHYKCLQNPLHEAYIESYFYERGLKGTALAEKSALKKIKEEINAGIGDIQKTLKNLNNTSASYEKTNNDLIEKFDLMIKNRQKLAKNILKKQRDDLDGLKRLYKEELSLQIPVTYWKDKAKSHRIAAYLWGASFALIILLTIIYSPLLLEHAVMRANSVLPDFTNNPLSLLFIVTFPAFLIIWLLRMFARNVIANFSHMHDAANRSVMTETFLALMSENKANDNDRILILNALFQPIGAQIDDGSPPHWFELMMERMNSKNR